jgi:hypothetical protein
MTSKQFKMVSILDVGNKIPIAKVFGLEAQLFMSTQMFKIFY